MDSPPNAHDAQQSHDAPFSGRGLSSRGAALLCIAEPRAELATMLVLQEIDVSVDLATDVDMAVRWARHARYDLIVVGGAALALAPAALRLRHAAQHGRVLVLATEEQPLDDVDAIGVEVLRPPMDVNTLMRRLWPAA